MANSRQAGRQFTNVEIASFCSQLEIILKSGISLIEGLSLMVESAESNEEQTVLQQIIDNYIETGDFSSALSKDGLFPHYAVKMIEIGSETGRLDDVLHHLALHYEREESIAKGIKNAVTYPLIMTGMIAIVIIVLMVKVMPVFNQVLIQLGSELTGFSAFLMNAGQIISRSACFIVVIPLIIAALVTLSIVTASGRQQIKRIGYKFKSIARIFECTAACRFASSMAISLSSGQALDRSIELAKELNEDSTFAEKLSECTRLMDGGTEFTSALKEANIFSGQHARMASIGSLTGSQDKAMEDIAVLYQEEIDDRINRFIGLLEPSLVIILSVIVGIVLLSVMLPLMGIMSTL